MLQTILDEDPMLEFRPRVAGATPHEVLLGLMARDDEFVISWAGLVTTFDHPAADRLYEHLVEKALEDLGRDVGPTAIKRYLQQEVGYRGSTGVIANALERVTEQTAGEEPAASPPEALYTEPGSLPSHLVPQISDLDVIRTVVEAFASGELKRGEPLTAEVGTEGVQIVEPRQVAYALNAAEMLQWLETQSEDGVVLSSRGQAMLETETGSEAERKAFRSAVKDSPVLQALAPGLAGGEVGSREEVAERIRELAGLSESTAMRRAGSVLGFGRV